VNFQPPRVQRQQQQQQQQEQQQQRNGPSKNAQTQSQQQKQLQQQQPKRKKEPILLGDIIAASKSQSKATASHPPVGLNTKRVMPNSHRNHKREVVVHVSGQTVQRRGKEKEEVRPKRPTVLKQIILKDREEKFREVKTEAGENADEILDQRLESHRQKLLQKGVKVILLCFF
jgi:DNA primase